LNQSMKSRLSWGGIKYSTDEFRGKMTVKNLDESGQVKDESFKLFASAYGIPSDWEGKTFNVEDKSFRIIGINPRRPKNPVNLTQINTGQTCKCSVNFLKAYMK